MDYRRVGAFLVALPLLVSANRAPAGQLDPLRCEAKHLRCEGNLYDCLSRCDRVLDRRRGDAATADSDDPSRCDKACYSRYGAALDRMRHKPPCGEDVEPADPEKCEAKVLRADAAGMLCLSRCANRAQRNAEFAQQDCIADCNVLHEERVSDIMASPVCAAGRVPAKGGAQ